MELGTQAADHQNVGRSSTDLLPKFWHVVTQTRRSRLAGRKGPKKSHASHVCCKCMQQKVASATCYHGTAMRVPDTHGPCIQHRLCVCLVHLYDGSPRRRGRDPQAGRLGVWLQAPPPKSAVGQGGRWSREHAHHPVMSHGLLRTSLVFMCCLLTAHRELVEE
jgi:hypothetical protein